MSNKFEDAFYVIENLRDDINNRMEQESISYVVVSRQTGVHRNIILDYLNGRTAYMSVSNYRLLLLWLAGLHQDDHPPRKSERVHTHVKWKDLKEARASGK
jgi:hypothetical protein